MSIAESLVKAARHRDRWRTVFPNAGEPLPGPHSRFHGPATSFSDVDRLDSTSSDSVTARKLDN